MIHEASRPTQKRRRFQRLERPGLTPKQERIFNLVTWFVLALFTVGWILAIANASARADVPPIIGSGITNPLSPAAPPPTPFLLDAVMRRIGEATNYRGLSGALKVRVQAPGDTAPVIDSLPPDVRVEYAEPATQPERVSQPSRPGIWNVLVRMGDAIRPVPDLSVIRLVPLTEKKAGRIGSYVIGSWPYERGGRPRSPAYAPPAGLVRVTPHNLDTPVSEHFQLRDFVTKGQAQVWPKYVALSTRLLDKLELTIQELERSGLEVGDVGVISGFRTPTYNESGGNPRGRAALSRHMYGDAMDIFIDNNRDGRMDDLNRDGRVDVRDARVLAAAADRVEKRHPSLIGGIGVYQPRPGAHSGFVHIDTRGYRARW
ncbi:MAG: YcbK family protein [Longimicrobiales bacterium]